MLHPSLLLPSLLALFVTRVASYARPRSLPRPGAAVLRPRAHAGSAGSATDYDVDVAVIGGGIAGSTISWLLQERHSCRVALIDPKADSTGSWYPNYGEWRDEWHALADNLALPELKACTTTEWEITDCFFGGSNDVPMDERTTLRRPYVRVDRVKMQALLRGRYEAAQGVAIASKLDAKRISPNLFDQNLVHTADGSVLQLANGKSLRCKVLVDASGLESRLVGREEPMFARAHPKELPTGFQIAYGFIAHVDTLGPYDAAAMTLFDYRTDHFPLDDAAWARDGARRPTFMYAMPLGTLPNGSLRVFFEETSLVGKGSRRLSFAECKRRAYARLASHGISVLGVEEEEYCYIPMGGELPDLTQRVVGFGGAANMVHPSTGYHACRMLAAAPRLAAAIGDGLGAGHGPDAIAAAAYATLWGEQNRGQRSFQAFGGDFLMQQPVDRLRGFFSAFFAVEQPVWSGFLAGWPGLPGNEYHETWYGRLVFALQLFLKMPNDVRVAMVLYSALHTLEYGPNTLLRSLVPSIAVGQGPADPRWTAPAVVLGDDEAKREAREAMKAFEPSAGSRGGAATEALPAPFN